VFHAGLPPRACPRRQALTNSLCAHGLHDRQKDGNLMVHWHGEISSRLAQYSGHRAEWRGTGVTVRCANPDSFAVSIDQVGSGFQVGFSGWHEEFPEFDTALNCFSFGLTGPCRLMVVLRGDRECAWTVQSLQEGVWETDSTTGLLLVPLWKRKRVEYRYNILPKAESTSQSSSDGRAS
jgi:hypothetical protein